MGLDRNRAALCPEFGEIVFPFSQFITSLIGCDDHASGLVIDLFIHEHGLVAHDIENNLFRSYDDVAKDILDVIGRAGWESLNTLYDRKKEPEEFWRALYGALATPIYSHVSIDGFEFFD